MDLTDLDSDDKILDLFTVLVGNLLNETKHFVREMLITGMWGAMKTHEARAVAKLSHNFNFNLKFDQVSFFVVTRGKASICTKVREFVEQVALSFLQEKFSIEGRMDVEGSAWVEFV